MSGPSSYSLTDANGAIWDLNNGPVALLAGAVGFGMPEEDSYTRETPLVDGQTFYGDRIRPRGLMLPVQIDYSNPDLARAFWDGIRPGAQLSLVVFTDVASGGDVTPTVIRRSIQLRHTPSGDQALEIDPRVVGFEAVALDFVADLPLWLGPTVSKTFQTAEDFHNFYAAPASAYVLYLSSGSTVDSASFTNPGGVDAWPVIRVDGPASQFSVSAYGAGFDPRVAGTVSIPAGYYLEVNTDPRQLTVRLYAPDTSYTNVFQQMDGVQFYPIPKGTTVPLFITLIGTGSITISLAPGYLRAI